MKMYYRDLRAAAVHPVSGEIIVGISHPEIASDLCDEVRAAGGRPEFDRLYGDTSMGYLHKPTGRFVPVEAADIKCSFELRAYPDRFVEVPTPQTDKEGA